MKARTRVQRRRSEAGLWDNGPDNRTAPGGATNTVIQGPRRLTRSRLMAIILPPRTDTQLSAALTTGGVA